MDDVAADIGLRQGLLVEDDLDGYVLADEEDEDEEELADETEEFGDDFGGDPDAVNEHIQSEYADLVESLSEAGAAIEGAKELYFAAVEVVREAEASVESHRQLFYLAVDTYIERKEHVDHWLDEHLDSDDDLYREILGEAWTGDELDDEE